jgi:uncharacterized protein
MSAAAMPEKTSPLARLLRVLGPVVAVFGHASFRDAFIHGLGIVLGGYAGLILWALFLAAPLPAPAPAPHSPTAIMAEHAVPLSPTAPAPTEHLPQVDTENVGGKVTLPLPGLTEHDAAYGELPIIRAKDKLAPFDAYRQPFPADKLDHPLIAVVMFDYGLSKRASGSILGVMPPEVNVALSPAARDAQKWAQDAFDHGHEIWLELSTEPPNYPQSDTGANTLLTNAPVEDNRKNLFTQLGAVAGYAGVINAGDSPYFRSGPDADFMAGALYERGLGLVVGTAQTAPTLRSQAKNENRPFYAGDLIWLDRSSNADDIQAALTRVEDRAKSNGFAIAAFRPTKAGRTTVVAWLATLKQKGLLLAPLSIIAEKGAAL